MLPVDWASLLAADAALSAALEVRPLIDLFISCSYCFILPYGNPAAAMIVVDARRGATGNA